MRKIRRPDHSLDEATAAVLVDEEESFSGGTDFRSSSSMESSASVGWWDKLEMVGEWERGGVWK